jgi:hypothetical protein
MLSIANKKMRQTKVKQTKMKQTCCNTSAMPAIYDETVNLQCESAHNTMWCEINTRVEKNCFSVHSRL